MVNFELVFVLTQEIGFSYRFYFEVNRKSIGSSKRLICFYMTSIGNFERFQHFNLETNFLKNANPFKKTAVPFFS